MTSTHVTAFGDGLKAHTLAEQVSEQIAKSIIDNNMVAGDKLPSERELSEGFGVSRPVVREALRGLAARGMVTVRSGVGASVASADASLVTDAFRSFLRGSEELEYSHVHEVRLMLELQIAKIACENATDDDIRRLEAIHARMAGDPTTDDAAAADVEFHGMIAKATHNPLYAIILDSLRDVLFQVRQSALHVPGRAHRGFEYHGEILDAIRRRDADAAVAHMREHLEDVSRALGVKGF
jgi:GntR family transcriptional regulator, transcriptional repressor for pyruvate dehydrogenase complex